jgi:hypothetical protein
MVLPIVAGSAVGAHGVAVIADQEIVYAGDLVNGKLIKIRLDPKAGSWELVKEIDVDAVVHSVEASHDGRYVVAVSGEPLGLAAGRAEPKTGLDSAGLVVVDTQTDEVVVHDTLDIPPVHGMFSHDDAVFYANLTNGLSSAAAKFEMPSGRELARVPISTTPIAGGGPEIRDGGPDGP